MQGQGRFLFIDGLRGVAALSVALFHCYNKWVSPIHVELAKVIPGSLGFLLDQGRMGVQIFFVLSGFVIAHSLAGRRITPVLAGKFILRRSLRLDPPYWVMIFAALAWCYCLRPTQSVNLFTTWGGFPLLLSNMFYVDTLCGQPPLVAIGWTLCLEVRFYLAYLLLLAVVSLVNALLARRAAGLGKGIVVAIWGGLAGYSLYSWFGTQNWNFYGHWFMFFTGVLVYWTLAGRVRAPWLGLYLLLLVTLAACTREPRTVAIALTAGAIYLAGIRGGLATWLNYRWLQYLGRISYSLYLSHLPVIYAVVGAVMSFSDHSITAAVTAAILAIIMSLLIARFMYEVIESPALRLSRCIRL